MPGVVDPARRNLLSKTDEIPAIALFHQGVKIAGLFIEKGFPGFQHYSIVFAGSRSRHIAVVGYDVYLQITDIGDSPSRHKLSKPIFRTLTTE